MKQQFICLLSNELKKCGFHIVLGFESSFKERVCTLRLAENNRLDVCINLGYVRKAIDADGCSGMLKVYYCAFFVAEYIKQIERAKKCVPQSYFEGLVFLNVIENCTNKKVISVYSPLCCLDKDRKQKCCVRPLEISSAMNAVNRLLMSGEGNLSERDTEILRTVGDKLLLYSGVPEISYNRKKVPVYTAVDLLKKAGRAIEECPEVIQKFPVLATAPFARLAQMTVNELFLTCVQSNDAFAIGLAVRLIAFLQVPYGLETDRTSQEKLVNAMNRYIDYSTMYCAELSKIDRGFMGDNAFAVKQGAKTINKYLEISGADVVTGKIHFFA